VLDFPKAIFGAGNRMITGNRQNPAPQQDRSPAAPATPARADIDGLRALAVLGKEGALHRHRELCDDKWRLVERHTELFLPWREHRNPASPNVYFEKTRFRVDRTG